MNIVVIIYNKEGFKYRETQLMYISKGKAIPLQAWTGPEGSRRLRLQFFKTVGM
jgi:hypothetical protein